jgi:hypothetical protein
VGVGVRSAIGSCVSTRSCVTLTCNHAR